MHVLYASMHVDLTKNCNVQVSCGLEALPEELSGLSSIELLDLRGNSGLLQAGGAALVTAGLTCLSSCRRLDLRLLKYRLDCGRLSCASSCHAFAGLSRVSLQPAVGFAANWHEPQCHVLSTSNISVLRCKTSCILIAFGCASCAAEKQRQLLQPCRHWRRWPSTCCQRMILPPVWPSIMINGSFGRLGCPISIWCAHSLFCSSRCSLPYTSCHVNPVRNDMYYVGKLVMLDSSLGIPA